MIRNQEGPYCFLPWLNSLVGMNSRALQVNVKSSSFMCTSHFLWAPKESTDIISLISAALLGAMWQPWGPGPQSRAMRGRHGVSYLRLQSLFLHRQRGTSYFGEFSLPSPFSPCSVGGRRVEAPGMHATMGSWHFTRILSVTVRKRWPILGLWKESILSLGHLSVVGNPLGSSTILGIPLVLWGRKYIFWVIQPWLQKIHWSILL